MAYCFFGHRFDLRGIDSSRCILPVRLYINVRNAPMGGVGGAFMSKLQV